MRKSPRVQKPASVPTQNDAKRQELDQGRISSAAAHAPTDNPGSAAESVAKNGGQSFREEAEEFFNSPLEPAPWDEGQDAGSGQGRILEQDDPDRVVMVPLAKIYKSPENDKLYKPADWSDLDMLALAES